jgi:predicted DNA-binding transcriptional regulator AlpA
VPTENATLARLPDTPLGASVPDALLLPAKQAAALCGVSVRTWWRMQSAAKVPAPVQVNGRPLWRTQELQAWVEAGCPDRKTWESLRKAKGGRS